MFLSSATGSSSNRCYNHYAINKPMISYIIRRLLLMFPTLIGIVTITFIIVQFVPGGPVDQMKSLLRGHAGTLTEAGGGALDRQGAKLGELDPKHQEQLKKSTISTAPCGKGI